MTTTIMQGDCRELLATLEPNSIDAVVTDPPYGIGFMGREWDTFTPATVRKEAESRNRKGTERTSTAYPDRVSTSSQGGGPIGSYDESATGNRRFQEWTEEWARECLRVLKPGGHMLVCGGPRTFHRVAAGIEDAGLQIRDVLCWLYGSGFPKSHNLKGEWDGWGTALKPGWEPIIMARKPFKGTVAVNVAEHGTGAINVDSCRIASPLDDVNARRNEAGAPDRSANGYQGGWGTDERAWDAHQGRWPANVVLDDVAAALLDAQSGTLKSGSGKPFVRNSDGWARELEGRPANSYGPQDVQAFYGDTGGASRFFYVAKASRSERNAGLDGMPERKPHHDEPNGRAWDIPGSHSTPRANHHPTVKPLSLMRWLVRMVTPPDGIVVDPFGGSGTTGVACVQEGFDCILMEREPEYAEIADRRVSWAEAQGRQAGLEGVA